MYFIVNSLIHNEYINKNITTAANSNQTTTTTIAPPPGMLPIQIDKPSIGFPSSIKNQSRSSQNTILPSTTPLMDQMKTLSVSSTPPLPTTTSSRPVSITSYLNEYEILDTSTQSIKKPTTNIASFPPRQNASLFTSVTSTNEKPMSTSTNTSKTNTTNGHYSSSLLNNAIKNDHPRLQSKANGNNKNDMINNPQRDTPISTLSNEGSIRFGNTSGPPTTSVTPSM